MSTPELFVGIDVAKKHLAVAVRDHERLLAQRSFANTARGVKQLLSFITMGQRCCRAVLEPTSRFHLRARDALAAHPRCKVMVVDPARAHGFLRAVGQRAKTDPLDAGGLALLASALNERYIPCTPPLPLTEELQLLSRRLSNVVQQRAKCRNRQSALDAERPTHRRVIASLKREIASHQREVGKLLDTMEALVRSDARLLGHFEQLVAICGFARQNALQLLGETAIWPADMTARQWTACAGLDPQAQQSGQSDPPQHISRRGNKYLRQTLWMAALNAARCDPDIKCYYEHKQQEGKAKQVALTIIMRKLLTAVWAMQHHDQPFLARKSFSVPVA